jgi:hypothetical protein
MEKITKRLDLLVQQAKNINSYDYNSVMKNLGVIDNQEKKIKIRSRKLKKANIKWEKTLQKMKKAKDDLYLERMEKISGNRDNDIKDIKDIKIFERSNSISINNNNISNSKSISVPESPTEKSNILQNNILKMSFEDESYRNELKDYIDKKIRKIANRNKKHKEEIKNKYSKKFNEDYGKYKEKLEEIEINRKMRIKQQEELKISKFKNYYEYLNEQKKKFNSIKTKEKEKFDLMKDKITQIEKSQEEKQKQLKENIHNSKRNNNNNNSFQYKRAQSLHNKLEKGFERYLENSKFISDQKSIRDKMLLEKERHHVKLSVMKDRSVDLSKYNVR